MTHTFRDELFDGGGSGAVGERGLFVGVRADEGDGIFSLGRAHQRRSVVNQRHPALLSVVNDLLASKLLQITVADQFKKDVKIQTCKIVAELI